MKSFLHSIIFNALNYLNAKTNAAKIFLHSKQLILGADSKLYEEANIYNFQNQKDKIKVGINSHIRAELLVFAYGGQIEIGDNSFIGVGSRIWSGEKITIGSNVLVSHNVNIIDTNTHEMDHIERAENFIKLTKEGHPKNKGSVITKEIIIHNYAWVNFNVTILKGVTIGEGAIIAANSVVTKDVPAFCLVAGNPAKIIKRLNEK